MLYGQYPSENFQLVFYVLSATLKYSDEIKVVQNNFNDTQKRSNLDVIMFHVLLA